MKTRIYLSGILIILWIFINSITGYAQLGVSGSSFTPDASSMLEVRSTNKGVLIPRVALTGTTDAVTIASPASSLLVYNTATAGSGVTAVYPGYYYNSGTIGSPVWKRLATVNSGNDAWSSGGNFGTTAGSNFLGTLDNQALDFRTNNILHHRMTIKGQLEFYNTGQSVFIGEGAGANDNLALNNNVFIGYHAGNGNNTGQFNTAAGSLSLSSNTNGSFNSAFGNSALSTNSTGTMNSAFGMNALDFNLTGGYNSAFGANALIYNSTGSSNSAFGYGALSTNNTGNGNSAFGWEALYSNTTGGFNTAMGNSSLYNNTSGVDNNAFGNGALYTNSTGGSNSAFGTGALQLNTIGNSNSAFGFGSLFSNTNGNANSALGISTLHQNTTGSSNTAVGDFGLYNNITGNNNTAVGDHSLYTNSIGTNNSALGTNALGNNTTGTSNSAIGFSALYNNITGNYNVAVGDSALYASTGGSNTATGYRALALNTTGGSNSAYGKNAMYFNTAGTNNSVFGATAAFSSTGSGNTAVGATALLTNTSGNNNTAIGFGADNNTASLSNCIAIGYNALASSSNEIRLGTNLNTTLFCEAAKNSTTASPANLFIDAATGKIMKSTSNTLTGSGNANKVAFWDGTSTLNYNNNFHWDNINGILGIGTSSPLTTTKVDVVSNNLYAGHFTSSNVSSDTHVIHAEVTGSSGSTEPYAFYGKSVPSEGYGYGGYFWGGNEGAVGYTNNGTAGLEGIASSTSASGYPMGIYGTANGPASVSYGVYGNAITTGSTNYGVYGFSSLGLNNYGLYGVAYSVSPGSATGIYAVASGSGTNYAGYFSGDLHITGTLSKGGGSFQIDHPLDPENKYLYHSFVESPDMMNIYNGVIALDTKGDAVVSLPDYFDALNRDFRYQLTAIGAPGPDLYIAEEVHDNQFRISGGTPGSKVSWQVTGVRKDPFAEKNRIQVEVNKAEKDKGKYLYPEAYGLSPQKGIDWERNEAMKKHREDMEKRQSKRNEPNSEIKR